MTARSIGYSSAKYSPSRPSRRLLDRVAALDELLGERLTQGIVVFYDQQSHCVKPPAC